MSRLKHAAERLNRGRALDDRVSAVDLEGVLAVHGEECFYCLVPLSFYGENRTGTFDHLIPKGRGGKNTKRNLVPACQSCNSSKDEKRLKWDSKAQRVKFSWEGVKPKEGWSSRKAATRL